MLDVASAFPLLSLLLPSAEVGHLSLSTKGLSDASIDSPIALAIQQICLFASGAADAQLQPVSPPASSQGWPRVEPALWRGESFVELIDIHRLHSLVCIFPRFSSLRVMRVHDGFFPASTVCCRRLPSTIWWERFWARR